MKTMIALAIENKKQFMSCLLTAGGFDGLWITEATLRTNVTYSIDTHLAKGFYSAEDLESLQLTEGDPMPFSMLRPTLYELIRGTHTPLYFQFVLMLPPDMTANLLAESDTALTDADISGLFLNLTFQNDALRATSAVSYRSFRPDHSADRIWDQTVRQLLTKNGIIFEEIG